MTTLTDFLLARIAETEVDAHQAAKGLAATNATGVQVMGRVVYSPARVLAECDAKRRIVEWAPLDLGEGHSAHIFRLLALPYADHPDCREEWKL